MIILQLWESERRGAIASLGQMARDFMDLDVSQDIVNQIQDSVYRMPIGCMVYCCHPNYVQTLIDVNLGPIVRVQTTREVGEKYRDVIASVETDQHHIIAIWGES
jgi:hypothetical protein